MVNNNVVGCRCCSLTSTIRHRNLELYCFAFTNHSCICPHPHPKGSPTLSVRVNRIGCPVPIQRSVWPLKGPGLRRYIAAGGVVIVIGPADSWLIGFYRSRICRVGRQGCFITRPHRFVCDFREHVNNNIVYFGRGCLFSTISHGNPELKCSASEHPHGIGPCIRFLGPTTLLVRPNSIGCPVLRPWSQRFVFPLNGGIGGAAT